MNFRFGEWYASPDTIGSQVSSYEVLAMPLSYLYIMMVAIDTGQLVSTSGGTEAIMNVIESFIVTKELKKEPSNDEPTSNSIKQARRELKDMIEGFHRSILKCDDILTEKEKKLDEKNV